MTVAKYEDELWAKDGGVYLGFGVRPVETPTKTSILDEDWNVAPDLRNNYKGDRHLLTVGPNGSGKTRRLLIPNICRLISWSTVIVDVKGELAAYTAALRAAAGQEVWVIDPFRVMRANYPNLVRKYPFLEGEGYNPLSILRPDSDDFPDDALRLAEALVVVEGKEPHWAQSAQELIAALIMYVCLRTPGTASLAEVRTILGLPASEFMATIKNLIDFAKTKECEELAIKGGRFSEMADTTEMQSVLSTALTQTRWLDSRPIKRNLAQGDYAFGQLKQHPTTVYLILPPRYLATHATWLRVMVTCILLPLMRTVEKARVPILFMLDEFAQLRHMAVIEDNMALLRGYGVKLWPVFQDFAQAQSLYKDRWESFVGNAGVVHSFAPQDVTTRKYLSELSGQRLYWVTSTTKTAQQTVGGQGGLSTSSTEAEQHMSGPNFWPQGLGRMKMGHAVLFANGEGVRAYFPDPEDKANLIDLNAAMDKAKAEIAGTL